MESGFFSVASRETASLKLFRLCYTNDRSLKIKMQSSPRIPSQKASEKPVPTTPHEAALKMIQEGHDDHVIMQDTNLSREEMKKLKKKS